MKTRTGEIAREKLAPKGVRGNGKKDLHDIAAELADLQRRHKDLYRHIEVLKAELSGLKLFIESLSRPGGIAVDAVADDLMKLGTVFLHHTHDKNGGVMMPAVILKKGITIRCCGL